MDNIFVTKYFNWGRTPSKRLQRVNRLLEVVGLNARLSVPYSDGEMTLTEHRINLFHLVSQVLAFEVPGDLVEIGSSSGHTSVLIQKILKHSGGDRSLHLYDAFEGYFRGWEGTEDDAASNLEKLEKNFEEVGLEVPEVHRGWFDETLPDQLPETVAFVNIDIGDRSVSNAVHRQNISHCLESVYHRMSRGAICVLADYADFDVCPVESHYPAVKQACDDFFSDKPESVSILWGPLWTQGYFRRSAE